MSQTPIDSLDRRRHARTKLHMSLNTIRLDPSGESVSDKMRMVDISRSGMGVLSDKSYYPGQRMVLCLPLSSVGGRRNIYASVVRCRQEESGYHVGLAFDSVSVDAWCGYSGAGLAAA